MAWNWRRTRQASTHGSNYSAGRDVIHVTAPPPAPVTGPPPAQEAASLLGSICKRFVQVYEWHGVERGEIPDFLAAFDGPSMRLSELDTDQNLLDRLDAPLLDFTTGMFNLDVNWLRRDGHRHILRSRDFYKSVGSFPDFLLVTSASRDGRERIWHNGFGHLNGVLTMVSQGRPTLPADSSHSRVGGPYVGGVYQVEIGEFRDRRIYRFHPLAPFDWGYWRSRYQLISMMSLADEAGVTVIGRSLGSADEVNDVCRGRTFPTAVTDGLKPASWSPPYPFMGSHAWDDDPSYLSRWTPYLEYMKTEQCAEAVAEAREERKRIVLRRKPMQA